MGGDRLLTGVWHTLLCGVHDGRWRLEGWVHVAVAVCKADDGLAGRSRKVRNIHRCLLHRGTMYSVTESLKDARVLRPAELEILAAHVFTTRHLQHHPQPGPLMI